MAAPATIEKTVEVSVLIDADRKKLDDILANLSPSIDAARERFVAVVGQALYPLRKQVEAIEAKLGPILEKVGKAAPARPVVATPVASRALPAATAARAAMNGHEPGPTDLGKCERKILQVLAQHGPCEANRLALLAGYKVGGGFRNRLSTVRTLGLMVGENTAAMVITDAGLAALGDVDPLPMGAALVDHWLNHPSFGKAERAIVTALVEHPDGLTAEQLCEVAGYEWGGGFRNRLSTVRTAGLLIGKNTETMRAHPDLLDDTRAA